MVTEAEVLARWKEIQNDEEKLLFIVGGPGSGKSKIIRGLAFQDGWKYMEAKDLINEDFLEFARDLRPEMAKEEVCTALKATGSEVVLLDNVVVLFAPILNLNPIALLKNLSKKYPLIVGWRGSFDGEKLYLEHNGNPHYSSIEVEYPNHIITL